MSNQLPMERLGDETSSTGGIADNAVDGRSKRLVYITGRHKYCSNAITTAKYNLVTFVPKFLFEQFHRYSNIFFLFIALMQQIPNVSPTGRFTTAIPLFFILTVSAIKEAFEDIKRHRADRGVNSSLVLVLNKFTSQWDWKHWQQIQVGDIVKITNDQFFPSDLFLLASSEPNGMCYIETANLDGETNLKIRHSLKETTHCLNSEQLVSDLSLASIQCDPPNRHLYEFHGNLKLNELVYAIAPENILLRGAKLRNTNWVFGCVIYTGHETKLMMNSSVQAPIKRSNVEKITNKQTILLFAILLFICIISATASYIWKKQNQDHWYLWGLDDKLSSNYFFVLLTFIILYNNLIPISLQVTLEMVRFIQASFINADIEMYCEETDTPAMARTSNLNEELGQVKYILSDKTGTLTRNVMEFKKCSIAGQVYTEYDFKNLIERMKSNQSDAYYIKEFLTLLSVCQTVVPEVVPNETTNDGKPLIRYQGASPDEAALVRGAQQIGFEFTARTPQYVFINALGTEEKYEILNVLDFTSDRKRMSTIVRTPEGKIKLYIKGADSMIYDRLAETSLFGDITERHLSNFASEGLRTLCCAVVDIEENTYQEWNKRYTESQIMDSGPNGMSKEQYINEVMAKIENNLRLVGSTAIEDKLQDGVPETIDTLLKAGIHIWVLTGDKQETAINIGHSCKLLQTGMLHIVIDDDSLDNTRDSLNEAHNQLKDAQREVAFIIDGKTLNFAMTPELRQLFMEMALKCKSVICCRVSPAQKAEIVEAVKKSTKSITLAIGDGANDVAMIRAANVGVGISGQEGLQAVHSSDYAIAQFRFLSRLLLVHGSWSMFRLCKLILYSFYKNIALYILELWFASVSAWSGQAAFDRWSLSLYNVIFTAAPPVVIGLFDRQCSAETMIKYPALYKTHNENFNVRLFWTWIMSGVWHSLLLFWLTYFTVQNDTLWQHGRADGGYLVFGNMLFTYTVITVCLKAGLEISSWTWVTHLAIWGSIVMWFIFLIIYSRIWQLLHIVGADMSGIDQMIFSSGIFWFGIAIIPLSALLIDISYKLISRTCFKTLTDQIIEMELANSPSQQSMLLETARMFKNVFHRKRDKSKDDRVRHRQEVELDLQHGYAFSQEEHGAVPQSKLIRVYDTTRSKPSGI
ncbi:probable phospholipid-transporting ATPase IA [Oppia nitens]|uniref:probable phospholipid-transporting ATPase IA n=1 Tax=Oppia nitens TaxID=1686743 RepID=UPI0023DAC1A1|nr:probable phospholipid-transporting ATPase IA [Oppia nitens]XP_054165884.1 probable phospholipid-transporting ATPase IA [Oppia nitens]